VALVPRSVLASVCHESMLELFSRELCAPAKFVFQTTAREHALRAYFGVRSYVNPAEESELARRTRTFAKRTKQVAEMTERARRSSAASRKSVVNL